MDAKVSKAELKVRKLIDENRISLVAETERRLYLRVNALGSGGEYELKYNKENDTWNCTCVHGSMFRWSKNSKVNKVLGLRQVDPGVCYHIQGGIRWLSSRDKKTTA